jgi:hypothetical protein
MASLSPNAKFSCSIILFKKKRASHLVLILPCAILRALLRVPQPLGDGVAFGWHRPQGFRTSGAAAGGPRRRLPSPLGRLRTGDAKYRTNEAASDALAAPSGYGHGADTSAGADNRGLGYLRLSA